MLGTTLHLEEVEANYVTVTMGLMKFLKKAINGGGELSDKSASQGGEESWGCGNRERGGEGVFHRWSRRHAERGIFGFPNASGN